MSLDANVPEEFLDRYMTEAVESTVTVDGEVAGHVGLLDLDGTSAGSAYETAENLSGTVAVLRSSDRSYHVWGLSIRSLDEWLSIAERLDHVDEEHISLSHRRECSVLRMAAKRNVATGEVVKPAPTVVAVRSTETDLRQSAPHLRALREVAEEGDSRVSGDIPDPSVGVGHGAPRRVYMADIGGGE